MIRNDFEGTTCGWDYNIKRNIGRIGCGVDGIHIGQSRFEM
jgi:hypothetical protein